MPCLRCRRFPSSLSWFSICRITLNTKTITLSVKRAWWQWWWLAFDTTWTSAPTTQFSQMVILKSRDLIALYEIAIYMRMFSLWWREKGEWTFSINLYANGFAASDAGHQASARNRFKSVGNVRRWPSLTWTEPYYYYNPLVSRLPWPFRLRLYSLHKIYCALFQSI